jgi:hypothetical protein
MSIIQFKALLIYMNPLTVYSKTKLKSKPRWSNTPVKEFTWTSPWDRFVFVVSYLRCPIVWLFKKWGHVKDFIHLMISLCIAELFNDMWICSGKLYTINSDYCICTNINHHISLCELRFTLCHWWSLKSSVMGCSGDW